MHHFAMAISDDPSTDFTSRVDDFIARSLVFKPELAICTRASGAFIASFQANRSAFGVESWSDISDESSVLLFGLPTFESQPVETQAIARTHPARAVKEVISRKGIDSLHAELGGAYLVAHAANGTIRTTATFCGYGSALVHRSQGLLIVGNKLPLILSLMPRERRRPNFLAVSWVCSTTMILGDQTAFQDITKIEPGYRFAGSLTHAECTLQEPLFFTPPANGPGDMESAFDRLTRRYDYLLNLPIRWHAHITGGKDSRAALSVMLASGSLDRVESFGTIGSEENGDVMVARQIVERIGIRNHAVTSGDKASELTDGDLDRMYERFGYAAWRYDGHLTSWDGTGKPAPRRGSKITLTGGGGEIYRQKGILFPRHDFGACVTRMANWYGRNNHLGIVNKHVVEIQDRLLCSFIARQRELGAVNLQSSLYIFHRLSNWGAAHFQNNASGSVAGLIDLELARHAQVSENCHDAIHLGIIGHCHPPLLELGLLNDSWEAMADAGPKPLRVPISRNFPWQFALVRDRWTRLVDEVIDGASFLGDVLDRGALAKLRKGSPPDASEAIKMIFGARTLIALYSGEARGVPDFMDEEFEPRCTGTYASRLRQSLCRAGFIGS